MKKYFLFFGLAAVSLGAITSCKDKNKTTGGSADSTTTTSSAPAESTPAPATETPAPANGNMALTYNVKFTPDTVLMGKDQKFFVQIMSGSGLVQQDPDGKVTGTELTIHLRGTNRHFVSDNAPADYSIYKPDQRLELDNGTNITCDELKEIKPDKESSGESDMIFKLPANTKPVKLHLYEYYSKTRYSLPITIEEKK